MGEQSVPQLRLKGFDGPVAPTEFGSLATLNRGLIYSPDDIVSSGDGVRVLRSSNVVDDSFALRHDDVFVQNNAVRIPYAKTGDILITASNGSPRLVGKHAIIDSAGSQPMVHGGFMLTARTENPQFVNALMSAPWYARFIARHTAGGNGAIGNLDGNQLAREIVHIPSTSEQREIGSLFSQLDSLLNQHRCQYRSLQKTKTSLLQKMVPQEGSDEPELRLDGFTSRWQRHRLGDLGFTYGGLTGKTKADFGHGDAHYVTYMDVFQNSRILDTSGCGAVEVDPKQHEVRTGDAFFTVSSETPEEVGMAAVWFGTESNVYLNSFCFGFRPLVELDSSFFAYTLRSSPVRQQFGLLAQGISRFNISKNKAMDVDIQLPALQEQQAIGAVFAKLDSLITAERLYIEKLQQVKSGLLQKMFI